MAFSMPISMLLSVCWFGLCVRANFGPFAKRSRSGSEKFYDDRFLIRFAAENLVSCVAAVWVLGRDFWAALVSLGESRALMTDSSSYVPWEPFQHGSWPLPHIESFGQDDQYGSG